MELDMKNSFSEIFEQFKLIDAFRDEFRSEFIRKMEKLSGAQLKLALTSEIEDFLEIMAYETMSFTEAVVDKDRNYPEYRLVEELSQMNDLLAKKRYKSLPVETVQSVKYELNEIILKHYPSLYELSGFGYRLLERNVHLFVANFVYALQEELKRQTISK